MKLTILLCVVVLVGVLGWIRFAPHRAEVFHQTNTRNDAPGDYRYRGGFEAVRLAADPQAMMQTLEQIILATPRTQRLAGSIAEGHASFITRTRLMGFPDTTNIWIADGHLHIRGHLRFGRSDFGVNQRRILQWLAAISQL